MHPLFTQSEYCDCFPRALSPISFTATVPSAPGANHPRICVNPIHICPLNSVHKTSWKRVFLTLCPRFPSIPHQLQLPPGCHVKNVRHPQQRRRMHQHRMLHQPGHSELGHSQHQRQQQQQQQQMGQNTPFGQLLQQMRQQQQHGQGQIHHRQPHHLATTGTGGATFNHVDEHFGSAVHPRRPMHRSWLRHHPSKFVPTKVEIHVPGIA